MVTMVLKPFTRRKNLGFFFFLVAVSAHCQKILVIQIVRMTYIKEYRKYQYSGIEVRK